MKHRYLKDAATLKLEPSKCTGCGRCIEVCPHNVFSLVGGKAVITDNNACMECGACTLNCPFTALSVKPGVGCATAIIYGWLKGTEPTCGCDESDSSCSEADGSCC